VSASLRIDILTLFPDMFANVFDHGVIGRALVNGIVELGFHDIRDHAHDRHRTVDDSTFGGGPGMVMKPEPLAEAITAVRKSDSHVVLMSPQGPLFDHAAASRLARLPRLVLVCGRYEGVDERVREAYVDEELSIGDYVLTGGELAAMVVTEAVTRLVPGVVGKGESLVSESHAAGLLEHPHYTRPRVFADIEVPEILLSGNHGAVEKWRRLESLRRTLLRRPDLLSAEPLAEDERSWLLREEPAAAKLFRKDERR
jgi:tRNA (guanine37-N1)-methyltransferase